MLITILSENRYKAVFFILFVITLAVLTITSNIIVLSTLSINPFADIARVFLMFIISILISLNITVILYKYKIKKKTSPTTTVLGAVMALFTTTCPICQPIWLIYFGFGSATAFLTELSWYAGFLSIALLIFSLYNSTKEKKCIVKVKK